jgi:phage host-nuclease inhibitor protein Gam
MARAATVKKAKPKTSKTPAIRRKSNASMLLEEKYIGREITDWSEVTEAKVYECLRHYGYFYDNKDSIRWAKVWVKANMTKTNLTQFSAVEDWRISFTVGALCNMMANGAVFDKKRMDWIKAKIQEAIDVGKTKISDQKKGTVAVTVSRRNPAEILKDKTSDFIGDIEDVLDTYLRGVWLDIDNYSVYNELKKSVAAYNTAKAIADYYKPLQDELKELITKKTPDLLEGYEGMTIKKRREYLKLITAIIDDAEKYMASKKAVRKIRAKKVVSATQQTLKVTYLKDSAEFKITSIDPTNIIGASEVYLFNAKYRTIIRLACSSGAGFTIKGTTIQDIDTFGSGKKKLRKPEEFFKAAGGTKTKINKAFTDIKTKPGEANGRLNSETIIYKAYK